MIKLTQKGKYAQADAYFKRMQGLDNTIYSILQRYGAKGVEELEAATPVDTGLTASSWAYEVVKSKKGYVLKFVNSNLSDNIPVAILIQYGHLTRAGTWVEGVDFINPALKPIFDKISDEIWKEVSK